MSDTAWKRIFSESLLLAVIPVLGTLVCFAFEVGYVNGFFGLPMEFVQMDVFRVAWVSLVALFFVPIGGAYFIGSLMSAAPSRWIRLIGGIVVCSVFWVTFEVRSLPIYVLFAVLMLINLIPSAEHARSQGAWAVGTATVLVAMLGIGVAGVVGKWCAGMGKWHYVLETEAEVGDCVRLPKTCYVLVRRYGPDFMFCEVDAASGEIRGGVEVRSTAVERVKVKQVILNLRSYGDSKAAERERLKAGNAM